MKYDDIAFHVTYAWLLVYSRFHIIISLMTLMILIVLLLHAVCTRDFLNRQRRYPLSHHATCLRLQMYYKLTKCTWHLLFQNVFLSLISILNFQKLARVIFEIVSWWHHFRYSVRLGVPSTYISYLMTSYPVRMSMSWTLYLLCKFGETNPNNMSSAVWYILGEIEI